MTALALAALITFSPLAGLVLAANIANTLCIGRRAARTCSAAGSRVEVLAP